jgi:hypothetical protein
MKLGGIISVTIEDQTFTDMSTGYDGITLQFDKESTIKYVQKQKEKLYKNAEVVFYSIDEFGKITLLETDKKTNKDEK